MRLAVISRARAAWARGEKIGRDGYWRTVRDYVALAGEVVSPLARMLEGMGLTLPDNVREVPIPEGWGEANRDPLPASVRFLPPGPDFVPLLVPREEGLHTGGPWLSPGGEVWKPLDGMWYVPQPVCVPTREAEVLSMMAGEPAFPCNWRVEWGNGRRWLVRKLARILGVDVPADAVREAWVRAVEEGLRGLNRRGWGVNDRLVVALDDRERPFIVDLSTAHPLETPYEDEEWRFWEWAVGVGCYTLVRLRRAARGLAVTSRPRGCRYVYLSHKPAGEVRGVAREALVMPVQDLGPEHGLTWALFARPAPPEVVRRAGLRLVWQPWRGEE